MKKKKMEKKCRKSIEKDQMKERPRTIIAQFFQQNERIQGSGFGGVGVCGLGFRCSGQGAGFICSHLPQNCVWSCSHPPVNPRTNEKKKKGKRKRTRKRKRKREKQNAQKKRMKKDQMKAEERLDKGQTRLGGGQQERVRTITAQFFTQNVVRGFKVQGFGVCVFGVQGFCGQFVTKGAGFISNAPALRLIMFSSAREHKKKQFKKHEKLKKS